MLVSKNWSSRSLWAMGLAALMAIGSVGCSSGDLPTASDVSVSAPAGTSAPVSRFTLNRPPQMNPSIKADKPFRFSGPVTPSLKFQSPIVPRFNLRQQVHSMSNGTLRIGIGVNNDDSGYAWPSANGVAHVRVDGVDWYVDQPDVWGSWASVDISLSPGSHTVVLVEDFWATHELLYNSIGNVTISTGQLIEQGAEFTDNPCHPSCP